jgi:nicotinate-nucleotide--dimethylbenzimidazole phosphoribosyltransferase
VSRVHCLDCAAEVVVDPRGLCPSGHHLGTGGARVAAAIGSDTPHPDEPEPWVGRIEPDEIPEVAPPAPRTPTPQTAPGLAPAAPPPIDTQDLFAELGALGDLDGDLDGTPSNGAPTSGFSTNGTSTSGALANAAPLPATRPPERPEDPSPWTADEVSWSPELAAAAPNGHLDATSQTAPAPAEPTGAHEAAGPSDVDAAADLFTPPAEPAFPGLDAGDEGWGSSLEALADAASEAPAPWQAPLAAPQTPDLQQAPDALQAPDLQQAPGLQQHLDALEAPDVWQAPAAAHAPTAPPPPATGPAVASAPSPSTVHTAPAGGHEAREALSEISALEAAVQSLTDSAPAPSRPAPQPDAPQHPPAAAPFSPADPAPEAVSAPVPAPPPAPTTSPAPATTAAPASTSTSPSLDEHELRRAAFADVASLGVEPATAPTAPDGPNGTHESSAPLAPPVEELQAAGAEGRPAVGIDTMNFTAKGGRPRRSDQPKRRLFGR